MNMRKFVIAFCLLWLPFNSHTSFAQSPPSSAQVELVAVFLDGAATLGKQILIYLEGDEDIDCDTVEFALDAINDMYSTAVIATQMIQPGPLDERPELMQSLESAIDGMDEHTSVLDSCRDAIEQFCPDLGKKVSRIIETFNQIRERLTFYYEQLLPPPPYGADRATGFIGLGDEYY